MAFADPQTLTINGVAKSLARISSNGLQSVYANQDESVVLTISHQVTKANRVRTLVRVDQRAVVTNPLDSSNDYDTLTMSVQIDRPYYGFTSADVQYLEAALETWLDSTSIGKLYGKES